MQNWKTIYRTTCLTCATEWSKTFFIIILFQSDYSDDWVEHNWFTLRKEPSKLFLWNVKVYLQGRGGGQVVSVLAFYSDDPSSNLLRSTIFL